jgi:hypothetical protein
MAKMMNIVKLRGTVDSVKDGFLTLLVQPKNPRGGHYHNLIPVIAVDHLPKAKLKGLAGKRIEMVGQVENVQDGPFRSVFRPFKEHFELTSEKTDLNVAKMVGETPTDIDHRPRMGAKRAFANALLLVGRTFINGVAFTALAAKLERGCPRGSILQIGGRLNWREWEDEELGWQETLEVVADSSLTKVIKRGVIVDELKDMEELGAVEAVDNAGDDVEAPAPNSDGATSVI